MASRSRLGSEGPTVTIAPESVAKASPVREDRTEDDTLEAYAERYFGSEESDEESVGGRTLMIRKAYQKVQQKQRRTQRLMIAGIALVALAAGGYAIYAHRVISKQTEQAQEIFYAMKQQDVLFADLEQKLGESGNAPGQQQVAAYMAERQRMLNDYDRYVPGLFDKKLNEKEKLVLRVTRMFGECDAAAPPDYIGEVMRYVEKWRSRAGTRPH